MGADFNIKPAGAPVAAPVARPSSPAAQDAVATQLPPSQSVAVSDASLRMGNDAFLDSGGTSQRVSIDRAAAQIVYKVVDNRTSLVIKQFPDEALLRSRAYARALEDARLARPPYSVTNLMA